MRIESQVEATEAETEAFPLRPFPLPSPPPAFPFSSTPFPPWPFPPFLVTGSIVVPAGGVAYLPAADATPVI